MTDDHSTPFRAHSPMAMGGETYWRWTVITRRHATGGRGSADDITDPDNDRKTVTPVIARTGAEAIRKVRESQPAPTVPTTWETRGPRGGLEIRRAGWETVIGDQLWEQVKARAKGPKPPDQLWLPLPGLAHGGPSPS